MSFSPLTAVLFRHDLNEGAIRRDDGQRVLAVSQSLVQGLHFALVETLGEHAQDILYRTGYEWALQDMVRLNQRMNDEFGGETFDFWSMEAKFVLEAWWAALEAAGWGTITTDLSGQSRGLVFVELHQSAVASALAGADQPVCHLYAGLFAGALSFLHRGERHAVEIECRAMNSEACTFIVGPGAEIDSAEAWRQQGISANEILRRVRG